MPSIFSTLARRWPPWIEAVLLALTMAIGLAIPDYSSVFDHAPTAYVCVDTSKAVLVENAIPLAIVLARNRPTSDERVDKPSLSFAIDRERASDSGMSNPLKRRLT